MHLYLHLASNSTRLFGYSDFFGTVDGGWSVNRLANPNAWLAFIFFHADDMVNQTEEDEEDLVIQAAAAAVIAAGVAAMNYAQTYYNKIPYHDSALTGDGWVTELLEGHPKRIRKELGVHKHVFRALIISLQNAGYTPSKFVTLEEQLAIFLYTCVTGLSLGHVCERFQRATETASKYVHLSLSL